MPLKNGNPHLAQARHERAKQCWDAINRRLPATKDASPTGRDEAITEIEQAMDDMADYVVGSALA